MRVIGLCQIVCLLVLGTLCPLSAAENSSPRSPAVSKKLIQLADPELVVELVCAEPAINSPVSVCWDADGAMYVVEMSDYPTAESGGKVKRLVDEDADGVFEKVTTFAEGLSFPSGAMPYNGGLLVTAAPDILYFKDTNGDGKADERKVLFTGFTPGNQQLRVNGLFFGLDNLIYGANGRSGGEVRPADQPMAVPVALRRHDFRFDPRTMKFEAIAGISQFGLARDDFQHRFLSWNTIPFRQVVIEEQDLNRNPLLTSGESIATIAEPNDTGRIFPISQPPRTFNRERTDFFNASAGSMIFRGDGLGKAYCGSAFVGEPLTNLISRRVLKQQGPLFIAGRADGEREREFLASADSWFHPVFIATGPDGCLYVADFYREWIEHPQFVPEALRTSVDFRVGSNHGRIWRIRHRDFQPKYGKPATSTDSAEKLVAQLKSLNGWTRDTAQRLLVERQDNSSIAAINEVVTKAPLPASRAQALWTLAGLQSLSDELLLQAAADPSPAVREQAIVLARREQRKTLFLKLLSLESDADPVVRLQVALLAGDIAGTNPAFPEQKLAIHTMVKLSRRDAQDLWMQRAILSGLHNYAGQFLQQYLADVATQQKPTGVETQFLAEISALVAAGGRENEQTEFLNTLQRLSKQDETLGVTLLAGYSQGLMRRGQSLSALLNSPAVQKEHRSTLSELQAKASQMAKDRKLDEASRLVGLSLALNGEKAAAIKLLNELLVSDETPSLQSAAAHGIGTLNDAPLAREILTRWGKLSIDTRRELLNSLIRQKELAVVLLDNIEDETIAAAEIDLIHREALAQSKDPALKKRAADLLHNEQTANRDAVVAKYESASTQQGDATKGDLLFSQNCIVCHQ
ncbi:MAG: PVC-type heme-binding CxxCH protein, partial [Planctomycetota bacterium]|nr:PVC-type heme-binding CxxCH protein [Planctomycetota bacterium]